MNGYDPERYMESTLREVKRYAEDFLNTRIYEVVMEFPGASMDASAMPMRKTIIHFEVDDIRDEIPGFSDQPMQWDYASEADDTTVQGRWAGVHYINFDVGIWASDDTGGPTARLRAKQLLTQMFGYPNSIDRLRRFSDSGDGGIEILRWTGGAFAQDQINDIRVYRAMAMELEVRVFSRTPAMGGDDAGDQTITEILQDPDLLIDENGTLVEIDPDA